MKSIKEKAFTLIELLAVIIILAIILLITVPMIGKIVKQAKKEAFKVNSLEISKAIINKCNNLTLQSKESELSVKFEDNQEISSDTLKSYFSGKAPDSGQIVTSEQCNATLAFYDDSLKMCAYKDYTDDDVLVVNMADKSKCVIGGKIKDDEAPLFTGYSCANPGSVEVTPEKYFTFDQATGIITGYSSEGPKDLVIPCTIGGKSIVSIASNAFSNKGLTSLIMPDSIITIGSSAFASNQISSLEIGNSVTTIGTAAFARNNITDLVIPNSVTSIPDGTYRSGIWNDLYYDNGVFYGNPLTKITLGSGLTTINTSGFYGFSSLVEVDTSRAESLSTIGYGAFTNCPNLYKFDFSNLTALSYVSSSAFSNMKLTDVTFNNKNNLTLGDSAFANNLIENLTFNGPVVGISTDAFKNNQLPDSQAFIMGRNSDGSESTTLASYGGANRSNITIPNKVVSLAGASFNGLGLTGKLVIGNAVTSIESNKFANNSITTLSLGSGVKTIGYSAFSSNQISSLDVGTSITTISDGAFASNRLTSLDLGGSVLTVGSSAFASNQITNLNLGTSLTTIGTQAFASNGITDLVLPDTLTSIPDGTYRGYFDTYYTYGAFAGNPIKKITLGSGLTTINTAGFYGFSQLTRVDTSRATSLSTIGVYAFSNCTNLYDFDFSSLTGLTYISSSAFSGLKLTDITFNNTSNLTIGDNAFSNNLIENLVFNGPVVGISTDAFKNNQLPDNQAFIMGRNSDGSESTTLASYGGANRSNITIPNKVVSLAGATFSGLGLTGTLVIGDAVTSIEYNKFASNSITTLSLGAGVKTIGDSAFSSNQITSLDVGTSVTSIGASAFASNRLTSLDLGSSILTVGASAFANNLIENLNLGTSVTTIDIQSFAGNRITNLVLPDSLTSIPSGYYRSEIWGDVYFTRGAFISNPITSITLGSGLKTIDIAGFYGFSSLTRVDTSRAIGLSTIAYNAFSNCPNLHDFNFSSLTGLTYIGSSAFANLKLTDVTFNNTSNLTIGDNAFANNLIENLAFNGPVVGISTDAFKNNQLPDNQAFIMGRNSDGSQSTTLASYGGTNRSNITIPSNVVSLAGASFNGLGLTGTLVIGDAVTAIESNKFASNSITTLSLGSGVQTIGSSAFASNQISSLDVGTSITTISDSAFASNKLTSLNLGGSILTVGSSAFAYNQIVNLNLGTSVTSINVRAFAGNKITSLVLPDSLTLIPSGYYRSGIWNDAYYDNGIFYGNPLTKITLGSGISKIDVAGFYGLSSLKEIDTSRATNLTTIEYYAFYGTGLNEIEIPSSTTMIGSSAFGSNAFLTKIFIKGKVDATNFSSLGSGWNGTCSNIVYELNSCYTYSGNTITGYSIACSKNIVVPSVLGGNTISTIAENAFASKDLTRVVLPNTITNIGSNAFNGNDSLDPIIVLGKNSQTDFASIGDNWNYGKHVIYQGNQDTCFSIQNNEIMKFYDEVYCSKDIVIPSSVTTISNTPFKNILLNSITVPNGTRFTSLGTTWSGTIYKVNFQGDSYDYNCFTLSGSTVTSYKRYCSASVDLSKSVQGVTITAVGDNAFKNTSITGITLGSNVITLGASAFEDNDLATINIVNGLVNIGNRAFYDTGLISVSLPTTVMTIGDNAFDGNSKLTSITALGKASASDFTSLGVNWNGTCTNIIYK